MEPNTIMLVLGCPSASARGATHSADRRNHPLNRSSYSPIPPRATKKILLGPLRWPPRPSHRAPPSCDRTLTPPSPARAPILRRAASSLRPLHLRAAIHSVSDRPSTVVRPIRSQPSRPRRAPPRPPPRCHREKVVAGRDIVSRGRIKDTTAGRTRMLQMHV